MKLSITTVNGTCYLAEKTKTSLTGAFQVSAELTDNDIKHYLKARNEDTLATLDLGAASVAISTNLTDEQELQIANFEGLMKIAEKRSAAFLLNMTFDKVTGKK